MNYGGSDLEGNIKLGEVPHQQQPNNPLSQPTQAPLPEYSQH